MPKRRKNRPVASEDHEAIVNAIKAKLPAGFRLLRLGNAALQTLQIAAARTRDFDASIRGPRGASPAWETLLGIAKSIDPNFETAQDRAVILIRVATPTGPVEVDLIRGRRTPGRFLTQDFLELVAEGAAELEDGTLVASPEALTVMKAWAAHDQEARGRTAKREQYLLDIHGLRERQVRDGITFDQRLVKALLAKVRPLRSREGARKILMGHGVLVPES